MNWFAELSPDIQNYLWGAAADGTGGLAAAFVGQLVATGGARLRRQFQDPQRQALRQVITESFSFALSQWEMDRLEQETFQDLFREWILSPVVGSEFRLLLRPRSEQQLDCELLLVLVQDEALRGQVAAMLDSPAWPARQGAAWALIAMPGGPPPVLLPLADLARRRCGYCLTSQN